jgi:biopolymer transport protein ExbD
MRTSDAPLSKPRRFAAPPMAEINVIPLVDITLVILIIFMVTTSFEKRKPTPPSEPPLVLPVELPSAAAAVEQPDGEAALVLGVDRTGRKYVGTEPVTTEVFHQRLKEEAAKNPQRRVRIDADREARYLDVVEVIELCEFEGLRNVGLHTTKQN